MEVADICCQGRVISVLEGGYGRTPQVGSNDNPNEKKINESNDNDLDKSIFSECAVRHLEAMIDPYDSEKRFPSTVD